MIFFKNIHVLLCCMTMLCSCAQGGKSGDSFLDFNFTSSSEADKASPGFSKPTPKRFTKEEYLDWYGEKRGSLVVKNEEGSFRYELEYRPSEIEALGFTEAEDSLTLDSALSVKMPYAYFSFSIASKSGEAAKQIKSAASTNYAVFDIQKDFSLAIGSDTLPCESFVPMREDLYLKGVLSYYLVFKKKAKEQDINGATVLFHDQLFNGGVVHFKLDGESFANMPTLKNKNK